MTTKTGTVRQLEQQGTQSGADFNVTFDEKDVEKNHLKENETEFTLSGEDLHGKFVAGVTYKYLELDGEYLTIKSIRSKGDKNLELTLIRHNRS